jgi:hypothetical protein
MDIETKIKDGAGVKITLDLSADGVKHIRILADSQEGRDRAVAQVQRVLPQIRKLEDALISEDLEHDPIVNRSWFIRLSLQKFFTGIHTDGTINDTANYFSEGACFTDYGLVEKCVRRLRTLNVTSHPELLTAQRRRSTICSNLETLGFTPEPITAAVEDPAA